ARGSRRMQQLLQSSPRPRSLQTQPWLQSSPRGRFSPARPGGPSSPPPSSSCRSTRKKTIVRKRRTFSHCLHLPRAGGGSANLGCVRLSGRRAPDNFVRLIFRFSKQKSPGNRPFSAAGQQSQNAVELYFSARNRPETGADRAPPAGILAAPFW